MDRDIQANLRCNNKSGRAILHRHERKRKTTRSNVDRDQEGQKAEALDLNILLIIVACTAIGVATACGSILLCRTHFIEKRRSNREIFAGDSRDLESGLNTTSPPLQPPLRALLARYASIQSFELTHRRTE